VCGEQKAQFETDRDLAVRIVTEAMNAHIATEHPGDD
jgi:hypothetical protein